MIRILSEGEEITVQTGKMEPLDALLIELSQVCNAVLGTLAIDAGCGSDDLKPVLLQMLQEDNSLEFMGHGSGTLHVLSN